MRFLSAFLHTSGWPCSRTANSKNAPSPLYKPQPDSDTRTSHACCKKNPVGPSCGLGGWEIRRLPALAERAVQSESEPVGDICGQLFDLRVVMPLDVPQTPNVPRGQEIDGDTLAAVATTAPDAVEVILHVLG